MLEWMASAFRSAMPQAGNVLLHILIQQRSGVPKVIFDMDETMFYNKQQEDNSSFRR
jgi:hypothetical protein